MTRPDGQNKGKGRKSNKQIKVAVCNEFVETIICEYLEFKTVFSR
jgi:ribonucleotide reductase alpha subunit